MDKSLRVTPQDLIDLGFEKYAFDYWMKESFIVKVHEDESVSHMDICLETISDLFYWYREFSGKELI